MRILLVYPKPDVLKKSRFGFSYDMLTIATIIKQYHEVFLHDYSCENYSDEQLLDEVAHVKYDAIIVECDSFALKRSQNIHNAKQILNIANEYAYTIAYGNYCYIKQEDFLPAHYTVKANNINYIIEQLNLLDQRLQIPKIEFYDDLPHIDRTLLFGIPFFHNHRFDTLVQTSKGCQNTCIFCQRKGWQSKYEAHSDNYVLDELRSISRLGFQNVWVIDENFTYNLVRAKRLLTEYSKLSLTKLPNLFISSWANIDYEFLDQAADCNIRIISFGIETGNNNILRYYKKNIDLTKVPALIQYANSKGIFTVGNFILGAPEETEDSIEETFELIRQSQFDQVNFKTLDYMIGSELYDLLPPELKVYDHVFASSENGLCNFSLDTLIAIKKDFLKSYYSNHRMAIRRKIEKYGPPYSQY